MNFQELIQEIRIVEEPSLEYLERLIKENSNLLSFVKLSNTTGRVYKSDKILMLEDTYCLYASIYLNKKFLEYFYILIDSNKSRDNVHNYIILANIDLSNKKTKYLTLHENYEIIYFDQIYREKKYKLIED